MENMQKYFVKQEHVLYIWTVWGIKLMHFAYEY